MADKNVRFVKASSPLGKDKLLFRSLTGFEELGRPFQYSVRLLSEDNAIKFADILGQDMTVELGLADGSSRFFHGYVTEFSHDGSLGRYAAYTAVLRPWLWFLTRTADCRIFQNKTVPDIVKEVLQDNGSTDVDDDMLEQTYRSWGYCVQYRETDFNFVSRLLEQEGIYYYFRHENGKHTIVLCDANSAHRLIPGYEKIPYRQDVQTASHEDAIFRWSTRRSVQPGAYALKEFDFTKPRTRLDVDDSVSRGHSSDDFEIFDYPGEYPSTQDGRQYVSIRLEELQAGHARATAEGNARGLFAGGLFELTDCPRSDQNDQYLVVKANYEIVDDAYESGAAGDGTHFSVRIEVLNSQERFRAERLTPKPVVQGPQTAIVVGKKGEEIWTDEYGRIKVQFHWDRKGDSDEDSSCWLRVAQVWAGKNWGAMFIPRIGQEVVVEFIEGDPDQPIVTGRVYNGDNMPPYGLPDNKTVSTIKSDSSTGGGGSNELRFEDKKGSEKIYLHGQKDQEIHIENDATELIGKDSTLEIKGKYTVMVAQDVVEAFKANHDLQVTADKTVKATNITLDATSSITLKVGGSTVTIDASGIKIKAPQVDVNGSALVNVQGGLVKIN
jgi:type VI secretion system secreted protein VgrG